MFLSSLDSSDYFPNNASTDFTIELPHNIFLPGKWQCALLDINFSDVIVKDLVILSDLCAASYIAEMHHSVLRTIPATSTTAMYFNLPIWFDVTRNELKRLRIYIQTRDFTTPSFLLGPVQCTLELIKLA